MKIPDELKYTREHEWVKIDGPSALVGITEFAQQELGELVFVELPVVGKDCAQGKSMCVVESTKAASDVYAPIGGTVREVNSALSDSPTLVNSDPYGKGWLCRLEKFKADDLKTLMTASQYRELLGEKA